MTCYTIERVAFGGEGVARSDGLVVFIPFTLEKELVKASIHTRKKNFARAAPLEILEQSAHRITPPCSYFLNCGGCQLQHSDYPHQLELKRRFVEDSLYRIGKIHFTIPPLVPSLKPFAYRRHISLQIHFIHNMWRLCFTSLDGKPLPINSCLLLHEKEDPMITLLQEKIGLLDSSFPLEGRLKILKTTNGYSVAFYLQNNLTQEKKDVILGLVKDLFYGVWMETPEKKEELLSYPLSFSCLGLEFNYSPFGFVQNHPEQSEKIYELIVTLMKDCKKIIDLYCGIGISTLLLTKENKQVIGIELNEESILLAKKNSKQNDIYPLEFICSSAESSLKNTITSLLPDALLVNPPKTGLDPKVIEALKAPSLRQLVYVSCHPPTLARDLSLICALGFSINLIQSFDCFPQTTHVETVVNLIR